MKRIITLALFVGAFALGMNAQLLYRISGNGLAKPSFIIGTHHLANVSFVEKIPGVKDALAQTDQVYGELNMDVTANPDSLKALQAAMLLPEGQTLKTVLTAEQYQRLDAFLTKMMGTGLSNPQVEAQMGRLTPMALSTQLTILMYLMKHMGEFDPSNGFDQYFQTQAKQNNEPVGGLETLGFQTRVLYGGRPMERQAELLMCLIDNEEFNANMLEEMTKAFYAQDLDAVKEAMDAKLGTGCDATPDEEARLIDNRNADWLTKMPAIMTSKPTFFAVGAGHLPGQKGVLEGLKGLGYTVEGVK